MYRISTGILQKQSFFRFMPIEDYLDRKAYILSQIISTEFNLQDKHRNKNTLNTEDYIELLLPFYNSERETKEVVLKLIGV